MKYMRKFVIIKTSVLIALISGAFYAISEKKQYILNDDNKEEFAKLRWDWTMNPVRNE